MGRWRHDEIIQNKTQAKKQLQSIFFILFIAPEQSELPVYDPTSLLAMADVKDT